MGLFRADTNIEARSRPFGVRVSAAGVERHEAAVLPFVVAYGRPSAGALASRALVLVDLDLLIAHKE